mgnify:CR=1 FL=1
MWIKTGNKEKTPEEGKVYWVTTIFFGTPRVEEAIYQGKGKWSERYNNHFTDNNHFTVEGWWDDAKPDPMSLEMTPPYIVFPECELNKNGINKKVKVHLLPDKEMRELGFTDCRKGYWYFCRNICSTIDFSITINKKLPEDFQIDVLNDDFGQPYDYQSMLSKERYGSHNPVAIKVYEETEKWMEYFKEKGIISGHEKGEYI